MLKPWLNIDCKTVGFFLKISKEIGNAWRKSLMRANRASLTHLLFDCSRVLEYAKIRTVLQSSTGPTNPRVDSSVPLIIQKKRREGVL